MRADESHGVCRDEQRGNICREATKDNVSTFQKCLGRLRNLSSAPTFSPFQEGILKPGRTLQAAQSKKVVAVKEVGVFHPFMTPTNVLRPGQVSIPSSRKKTAGVRMYVSFHSQGGVRERMQQTGDGVAGVLPLSYLGGSGSLCSAYSPSRLYDSTWKSLA